MRQNICRGYFANYQGKHPAMFSVVRKCEQRLA